MARTNNQSPRIAGEPRRRFAFLSRVESHIQGKTLGGLMELVPLLVTVIVITFIIGYTDGFVRSLGLVSGRPWDFPGVGLIACIVVLYLAGLAIATYPGRKGMDLIHVVLNKIPVVKTVYSVTQQATVCNCSDLWGSTGHQASHRGAAKHGICFVSRLVPSNVNSYHCFPHFPVQLYPRSIHRVAPRRYGGNGLRHRPRLCRGQ